MFFYTNQKVMDNKIILCFILVTVLQIDSAISQTDNQDERRNMFGCLQATKVCPNKDVRFFLYTRGTQNNPTELNMFDVSTIGNAPFVFDRPLIFIIHGYTGHHDFSPNPEIRPAYFANDEYNIISLDYNSLALEPCYVSAVRNLRVVGNCTAQLIDYLVTENLFSLDSIHVIGFSLGGQTAGIISTYMKSGKLKRITALDPAKPLFVTADNKYRIDESDAEFVQVIHTDVFERGILLPTGHVDFYPNGGYEQPGCRINQPEEAGGCNHQRAPEYFAESVNTEIGFWGYECSHWYLYVLGICQRQSHDSIALMGAHTPPTTRGMYFLRTNSKTPFAKGKDFSSKSLNDNELKTNDISEEYVPSPP